MMERKESRTKAESIRSFLDCHQPKLPEARGFLQFLLAKEEILRRLDIATELNDCPNAILVSAKGSGTWPFFYRTGDRYFHKTSQAVVELMRHVPETLCLCLSTSAPDWTPDRQEFLDTLSLWHEEVFIDEIERVTRRQVLLEAIDDALTAGDRGSFDQLTTQLRQLS